MPRGARWTERQVAWYERANERSDYAAQVLGGQPDPLDGCRTALDVGAGFGALTVPLARRLDAVTAVEPSPAMARALRAAVARAGLGNVKVVETPWTTGLVQPHDLVLCAHVSELVRPGAPFLIEVGRVARRRVLLVRDIPGGQDKFFYAELYPMLLGRPYEHRYDYPDTLEALRALGIRPRIRQIEYASDQPFDSLEEACDFWMEYMGLDEAAARDYLRGFLARRLRREGRRWIAPFRKRAAVIEWSVAETASPP